MLRGLAVLLVLVTLLAVAVELYLRSRARTHWRGMEVAAERELLGGGLQGLLRARAMGLGGAAIADDEEAAATVALASAMLASDYGLDETAAALTAADAIDASPSASPRAQALKLASRALQGRACGGASPHARPWPCRPAPHRAGHGCPQRACGVAIDLQAR